jgi:hypothetical protein
MDKFTVEYELREPKSRNQKTGSVSYSRAVPSTVTVEASNASEARKKAANHPKVVQARERVNARIPDTVQGAGGKARLKINSVSRGGGAILDLGRMATGTDLPPKRKMKGGGAVMSNRGGSFKGLR